MRASLALAFAFALAFLASGCVSPALTPAALAPAATTVGSMFGAAVMTDPALHGSEPSIAVDSEGRIFISGPTGLGTASLLWVSEDNGTTWRSLDYNSFKAPGGRPGLGGGDTSIAIGPKDEVYVTDLWAGSSSIAVSKDNGKTWMTSPISSTVYNDREWNTVDAKGRAYYLGRTFAPGAAAWVTRSDDGGTTWKPAGNPWIGAPGANDANMGRQDGAFFVNPKTDALGVAYSCSRNMVCLSTSADGGSTWKPVVAAKAEGGVGNLFPSGWADDAGNWYVTWAETAKEGQRIGMAWSADGATWSPPTYVSDAPASRLMPWMTAGDEGRVDIIWYESNLTGDTNDAVKFKDAEWRVMMAQSLDATSATPTWTVTAVTPDAIHKGTVSTRGFNPSDRAPPDRGLGDFMTITLDSMGMAHIAFVSGSRGGDPFHTMHVAQTSGASLYASGHKPGHVDHSAHTALDEIAGIVLGKEPLWAVRNVGGTCRPPEPPCSPLALRSRRICGCILVLGGCGLLRRSLDDALWALENLISTLPLPAP